MKRHFTLTGDSQNPFNPPRGRMVEACEQRTCLSSIVLQDNDLHGVLQDEAVDSIELRDQAILVISEGVALTTDAISIAPHAAVNIDLGSLTVRAGSVAALNEMVRSGRIIGQTTALRGLVTASAGTDATVRYALHGDSDLNGQIDADDYFRIDVGFLRGLSGYVNGDLNYDGTVDADDYYLIDSAFLGSQREMPSLSSNPEAAITLFLDFDGAPAQLWSGVQLPATPAFSLDDDLAAFSDQEIAMIREIWEQVAGALSAYDINVTTLDPGRLADGESIAVVIGGRGEWCDGDHAGAAYVGAFSNKHSNVGFVFEDRMDGSAIHIAQGTARIAADMLGDHLATSRP